MMTKILLDTDIGTDIDDAVCLAYLLAQPECELLGITTVTGRALERAMLASALCKAAGRDIPILPGADDPLLIPQKQTDVNQAPALTKWDHDTEFPRGEAVEFLRRTIRENPGEVVLLTIGPLTNAGLLFATDSEVARLLKGLVMMVGLFGDPPTGRGPLEWNAIGDAHATAIVYRAPTAVHQSIGLDVTLQCRMPADEVRERFQVGLLRPVLDFAEEWFTEKRDTITFHDPLAAATLFDDGVCSFERGRVDVELVGLDRLGQTKWTPEATGPHEVALGVNPSRFFEHFFSVFD
jgi:inosine-uridine nucleoside N-ribohydrolase